MEASVISKTLSTTIAPFVFHRLRNSTSLFTISSAAAARRFSRAYRLPDSPHSPSFYFSVHRALRCASRPDVPLTGSGGGDGNELPGAGGGAGGGGDGDDARNVVDSATVDAAGSSEVIILDVGGMSCGGCAASVKRILVNHPQVSTASVNLTTETAIIWPKFEAKTVPNWHKELGDALAKHLTFCGFKSNLRGTIGSYFSTVNQLVPTCCQMLKEHPELRFIIGHDSSSLREVFMMRDLILPITVRSLQWTNFT